MKVNVVLVDDHTLFRKGLRNIIEEFDFIDTIEEACNGHELIQLMEKSPTKFDIILLDINMPVMDGIKATELIRKKNTDVHILILSMEDDEHLISKMVEMGINGYLLKNINPKKLKEALQNVIEKDFYFDNSLSQLIFKTLIRKNSNTRRNKHNSNLTKRELEVLQLICKEFTASEIAEKLFISARTVEGHRSNLFQKTGAKNTAGLVVYAIKNDLVSI